MNLELNIKKYAKLLNDEPNNLFYLKKYVYFLSMSNNKDDLEEAITIYQKLSVELNENFDKEIAMIYRNLSDFGKAIFYFKKVLNNEDNIYKSGALLEISKIYIKIGNYEKALETLKKIRNRNYEGSVLIRTNEINLLTDNKVEVSELEEFLEKTNNEDVRSFLVDYYYLINDEDQFLKNYRSSETKRKYFYRYSMASEMLKACNYDGAVLFYKLASIYSKGKVDFLYYKIGECYEKNNNISLAIDYYKKATEYNNKFAYLRLIKIEQLLFENDKDCIESDKHILNAINYCKESLISNPDDTYVKLELAKLEYSKHNYSVSLRYVNEILDLKNDRLAHILKGKIYFNTFKYDDAIKIFIDLLNEEESKEVRLELGRCYSAIGKDELALKEFNYILKITDGQDDYAKTEIAKLFSKNNEKNKAIDYLKYNISNELFSIIQMACLLSDQGHDEEAIDLLKKIDNYENNPKINYTLSKIYLNLEDFDNALLYAKKAYMLNHKNKYINYLARCYLLKKDYQTSITIYESLIESNEFVNQAMIGLSEVYLELNDLEKSFNYIYPVLETKYYKQALVILSKIEKKLGHSDISEKYLLLSIK